MQRDEQLAPALPGDLQAIAQPDEKSGEVVALFVVKKDQSLTEQEMIEHCRKQLTGYKVPKHVFLIAEAAVPRTGTGKVAKPVLRREAEARLARPAAAGKE